jgi:quercetin dioxygenase-like cupin family protein
MPNFKIFPLNSAPRVPFKFDGRILYSSGSYELVHLTLQPGEGMEPHGMPFDVIFYVVEGTGMLRIGEEEIEVQQNTAVHVAQGVTRAWRNEGNKVIRILVNKLLV